VAAVRSEWPLRERAHEALTAPVPRFELDRFEAPDTVFADEELAATIVVTNTGEVDGTFRATVNDRGALSAADNLDLSVPAVVSRTTEYDIALPSDGSSSWNSPGAAGTNERRS
jgi:hypothetical protein